MEKDRRLNLQSILETILGSDEVHFQPPQSVKLKYPTIIYNKGTPGQRHANNQHYIHVPRYDLMVIERDPDSDLANRILKQFPCSLFDRKYTADNLYHTAITIYY